MYTKLLTDGTNRDRKQASRSGGVVSVACFVPLSFTYSFQQEMFPVIN